MIVESAKFKAKILAAVWTAAAILLAGGVPTSGQAPGQGLGQVPGQGSSPPPLHIPHLGGPRQERSQPETPTEGQVYVLLWFNMEDYILPQSDDAAKRLAVFLTQQGIPATFKVVGAKARVLQQRQRQDVISAIAQHDIGYYTNTHSQHPTVAEYESNLDWGAGVEEFTRRERPGLKMSLTSFVRLPWLTDSRVRPGRRKFFRRCKSGVCASIWAKVSRWDGAGGRSGMGDYLTFSTRGTPNNCAPTKIGPTWIWSKPDFKILTSP